MNSEDCIIHNQAGFPVGLDIGKCADWIRENLHVVTLLPCKRFETMMYYHDGMYIQGADKLIMHMLESAYGDKKNYEGKELLNIRRKTEIMDKVASKSYREMYAKLSPIKVPTFDQNLDIINMCNGLYNWRTGEFREHDPDYLSQYQIPVNYDPDADCGILMEIIRDVLKPYDVEKYLEFLAYCFYRDYKIIQKAMILFGPSGSGKTQLAAIVKNMFGDMNTTCVTLQMLGGSRPDPYATAKLYNMHVNIVGDMDDTYIHEDGIFKMLTSGEDRVNARKIYGAPFDFENTAKFLGLANCLPPVNDKSDAFYRRLEILELFKKFSSDGDKFDRLYAINDPVQLSGLFNECMERLPKLIERRKFTNSMTIEEAKKMYVRASNTVEQFIVDCVEPVEGKYISKKELYATYCKFCKDNHLATCSNVYAFGRELKKVGWDVKEGFRSFRGKQVKCWLDIEVKYL